MNRYLPIVASITVVSLGMWGAYHLKHQSHTTPPNIGTFEKKQNCIGHTHFLDRITRGAPVAIDLTQQSYRGIAFWVGRKLNRVIHKKSWERFEHMGTYVSAPNGDMYIAPMPYISIKPTTFNLQKNIYRLDSNTGQLTIWMRLEDVHASSTNPFGVMAIEYDCDDDTLWVAALDESDYHHERGVIYHIDIKTKKILQTLHGVDALSLKLIHTNRGKYLFFGSARKSYLGFYTIKNGQLTSPKQIALHLPDSNLFIRKIIVTGKNRLLLQTIPFSYTLIAQTVEQGVRTHYKVYWNEKKGSWEYEKKR